MIEDIQRAISLLFQPGQLVEIRGKFREGGMASMYFTDLHKMARVLEKKDANGRFQAIWYTLQRLKPGIDQSKDPGKATSRKDIAAYEWLVIDIDRPRQPKGTKKENATDAELQILARCRNKVQAWLRDLGWPEPLVMCSGNGWHLLYKVPSWPADAHWFGVLKDTLKGIAYHFRDISGEAKDGKQFNIDESLSEPEQIIKAYGTWSRLSERNEGETPWRESGIVSVPKEIVPLKLSNLLEAQMELPTTSAGKSSSTGKGRPYDPEWYESRGVGDLFDWAHPYLVEGEEFEYNGEIYHPSSNCPIHADDDGIYEHSGQGAEKHYAIIVNEKDQTIRNNCFSGEVSLGQVIAKINKIKVAEGKERYPHRVFLEKSDEDGAAGFGAELADDTVPVKAPVAEEKPAAEETPAPEAPKMPTAEEIFAAKAKDYKPGAVVPCAKCGAIVFKEMVPDGEEPRCPDHSRASEILEEEKAREEEAQAEPEPTPDLKGFDKSFDLVHTETKSGSSGLRVLRISDSPDEPVAWLWPGRIPAGVAFTISGPVGCNKSMALLDMASRISRGADWPDGRKNTFGSREVLICATEDELRTVIRPRLRAAGANLEKCLYLETAFDVGKDGVRKSRAMNLEQDTQRLYEALLANPSILLVILDPLTGFYGNADPNDNKKIRPMVTKIAKMCMRTKAAVACIIHENKDSDRNAVDKMMGAGSVSQVIRAGMRFSSDQENQPNGRIMASLKLSHGKRGGGMKFDVEQMDLISSGGLPLTDIGYVKWTTEHDQTADQIKDAQKQMQEEGGDDTKLGVAMAIFEKELANGKRLHRKIHPILEAAGVSDATKRRAKAKLGIVSSVSAPWFWWLPGKEYTPESPERKIEDAEEL